MANRHRQYPWSRAIAVITDFIRSLVPPAGGTDRLRTSRTRKAGIGIFTIGVTLAATCLAAYANAANPFTDATHQTSGTASVNADGTVSVHVTGTWNWGDLSGSSAQSKCENRYGVGWSVDWSGVSTSKTPGFSWAIKSTPATYFHVVALDGSGHFVTTHAMDGVYPFTGPCTAQELALDPTGPSGPWSADFVYPNVAAVPPRLCANFYDLHGSPGNLPHSTDLDPTQNGDNSIKTNSFNPAIGQGYCFTPTFVTPVQHLAGHIYDCGSGATTTEVGGGTLGATGPSNVASQPNPLNATVDSGSYTVSAVAPANHHFVACGSNATINSPTSASQSVNVPSNGTGTAVFYVAPDTQTLAGHIYDCMSGATTAEVAGGTLSATGPTNVASQPNPMNSSVNAGSYTVTAAAPPNHHFVSCGTTVTITNPTSATLGVSVPSNGTGTAVFYVAPDTQTLAGHIYDCSSSATTTEVGGGTLSATGPTNVASQPNPMSRSVSPGGYTVTAGAPNGYHFVNCGSGATINSPTSATQTATVPTNGTGTAVFYVAPDTQALIGHIYDCTSGATTAEVAGGTLSATGPSAVGAQSNPMTAANINPGQYVVDAVAPAGHHFVTCGSTATITSPTNASQNATVPSNGTGTAVFYVAPDVQMLAGHIYDCSAGATTDEIPGGTVSATGPTNVAGQANPMNAAVSPGSYSVTAGAPSGYHFVDCGSGATINSPTSATQAVTVPTNGSGTATFYVVPDTQALIGHIYDCASGASTTEVLGGSLSANGPSTVASQSNPLNAPNVAPGQYVMLAGAPAGYHFVDCGSGATITNPGSATQNVTVPANGTGTARFFVSPDVPVLSINVDKANDASGDGAFGDDETGTAGGAVTFRVTITNNSAVPVVIDSISDVWPGAQAITPTCAAQVVGTTLHPNGGSISCVFTINGYVPSAADSPKVNTATVVVHQSGNPSNSVSGTDTSAVRGAPVAAPAAVLGGEVTRAPEAPAAPQPAALPRTGATNTKPLFFLGIVLVGLGAMLIWMNSPVSALPATRDRRRLRQR